jgi:hypothetical protein
MAIETLYAEDVDQRTILTIALNLGIAMANDEPLIKAKLLNCLNLMEIDYERGEKRTTDRAEDGDGPPW